MNYKNQIIFTSGFLEGDDLLTTSKGHRSDVVIKKGENYYTLNFIDLKRLKIDLEQQILDKKNYFIDTGLIIIDIVTKDSIIKAVKDLLKTNFFSTQKALDFKLEDDMCFFEI